MKNLHIAIVSALAAPIVAHAAMTANIYHINGQPVASTVDIGSSTHLAVTGYVADISAGVAGAVTYVKATNHQTGQSFRIPVARRLASPEILSQIGDSVTARHKELMSAGFMATIDPYLLTPGNYEINSVVTGDGNGDTGIWEVVNKGYFTIPEERVVPDVTLTDSSGATIPIGLVSKSYSQSENVLNLDRYPALRNGDYRLTRSIRNKYGVSTQSEELNVRYIRPVTKVAINTPVAEGFSGMVKRATLTNPLTGRTMTGLLSGKIKMASQARGTLISDGVVIPSSGEEADISINDQNTGSYSIKASTDRDEKSSAKIWINAPDAPDLLVDVQGWNPDSGIAMETPPGAYALGIDTVQVGANSISGGVCAGVYGTTTGEEISGNYSGGPVCAVRYTALPPGLTQETPTQARVTGKLSVDGENQMSYETGIIWVDPETGLPGFYKSNERTLTLNGLTPTSPTITFTHANDLAAQAAASPDENLTYTGSGSVAGYFLVDSRYSGVSVRYGPVGGEKKTASSNGRTIRARVVTNLDEAWETGDYEIETWYNNYPQQVFTHTLTFTAVPNKPLVITRGATTVSTEDTIITGNLGSVRGGAFIYDPPTAGGWNVTLYEKDYRGNLTQVAESQMITAPDGSFTFNLGMQSAGRRTYVAIGETTGTPSGVQGITIRGRDTVAYVLDGSPLTGQLMTNPTTLAQLPTSLSIGIRFDGGNRITDISEIVWQMSRDGTNYSTIEGEQRTSLRQSLTESGQYWFKASVTNRHSGLVSDLEPVLVTGYQIAKAIIEGDSGVFVGTPVTLTATAQIDADFRWEVRQSRADDNPLVATGDTLTFTPTRVGTYIVSVITSERNLPADATRATTTVTKNLRAQLPSAPAATIAGPRVVETGKTYTFTATTQGVFSGGYATSSQVLGRWILPNGDTHEGMTLSHTVADGDLALRYETWLDIAPDNKTETSFALSPWTYNWPDWRIATRVYDNRVPASLSMKAEVTALQGIRILGGEPITYQWSVPASFRIVSQKNDSITVEANEPGEFRATVIVSDSRGNATEITSDIAQIAPAPDLMANLTLVPQDRWLRAPDSVLARINVTQLPKNDRYYGATLKLDGQQVSTVTGSTSAVIQVPTPGFHTIEAIVRSAGGQVTTASGDVSLIVGTNPECSIRQSGDGITSLLLTAYCTLEQGRIASYAWSMNGEPMPALSSSRVSFATSQLEQGVNSVSVTVTTDKGQQTTAEWSRP